MLTLKQVEQTLGEKAAAWKGRCFEIAYAIVKAGLVKGRAVYGHWRGPVSPRSMFYKSSGMGFVQHGWVLLEDGSVIDPTRWAFEGKRPYIYIGASDHYDEGGNVWRSQQAGPPPVYEELDECRDVGSDIMDSPTWTFVEKLLRIDITYQEPGVLTVDQLRWLAHVPPSTLGLHAKAVYAALEKLNMSAFIPIDNQRMVEARQHG